MEEPLCNSEYSSALFVEENYQKKGGKVFMPAGLRKRIYKKRYKASLERIVDKCPLAFSSRKERKRYISQVTSDRMSGFKAARSVKRK